MFLSFNFQKKELNTRIKLKIINPNLFLPDQNKKLSFKIYMVYTFGLQRKRKEKIRILDEPSFHCSTLYVYIFLNLFCPMNVKCMYNYLT